MTSVRYPARTLAAASACILGAGLLVAACSSDDDTAPAAPLDASPGAERDAASPALDAAPEEAGREDVVSDGGGILPLDASADDDAGVLDGGGLLPLEPDAGVDEDAGVDAGPSCSSVLTGTQYSTSTCSSALGIVTGGALTTATYVLKSIVLVGSQSFCASAFTPYDHRAGLIVTASSPSAAKFQFVDFYRKTGSVVRPTSYRYDADVVASSALLTFTPRSCATRPAPSTAKYSVTTDNGKKAIVIRLPYGTGSAMYRFVES